MHLLKARKSNDYRHLNARSFFAPALFVTLIFIVFARPLSAKPSIWAEDISRAQSAMGDPELQEKYLLRALEYAKHLSQDDPRLPASYYYLSNNCEQTSKLFNALKFRKAGLAILEATRPSNDYDLGFCYLRMSVILIRLHRPKESLAYCEKAKPILMQDPGCPPIVLAEFRCTYVGLLITTESYSDRTRIAVNALPGFLNSIRTGINKNLLALYLMDCGDWQTMVGDVSGARKSFEAAAAIAGGDKNLLGSVYVRLARIVRYDTALCLSYCRKAIAVSPDGSQNVAWAYDFMVGCYRALSDRKRALAASSMALKRAFAKDVEPGILVQILSTRIDLLLSDPARYAECDRLADQMRRTLALNDDVSRGAAYFQIAKLRAREKQYADSEHFFELAQADPLLPVSDRNWVIENLVEVLNAQKKFDEANKWASKVNHL